MEKSIFNLIKGLSEASFVFFTTIYPINKTLGYIALLIFTASLITSFSHLYLTLGEGYSYLKQAREYLPSVGFGLFCHAVSLHFSQGEAKVIALYAVFGVVTILIYIVSFLIVLAQRNRNNGDATKQ